MGKFVYAILTAFAIEMALWLFAGTSYAQSSVFSLLANPSILTSSAFYLLLVGALAAFAASAIIVGNIWQINVYALYAGVAAVMITFGLNIVHLFIFIQGELSGLTPEFALPITMLICAPLLLYYLIATMEWVRNN